MPTLELPNLAAYTFQKQVTPPPIASPSAGPIGPVSSSSTAPCYSGTQQTNLNLVCEQGATLTVPFALVVTDANGVSQPLDITGNKFQYTAKTDPNLPDTDPSVVKVDWTETTNATQGKTSLVVPSNITINMKLVPYYYQVRMVSSVTSPSPVVTPLFSGTQTMTQPVSTRYT
jgi:hypothetical protein